MSSQSVAETPIEVSVSNIGGIDETTVELPAGVTVLEGRNATNRTSFLQAIMGGLGSDGVSLKGDAEEGSVELTLGGETYTRRLYRRDGTVVFDGEPYLEDAELADLFSFLLESNEARRAVERGDDLYDLIMRPVDTDEIDDEIDRLEDERETIEAELEELETLEDRLPGLEEDRTRLEAKLEETREELQTKEAALEELDAAAEPSEAEAEFEALREARHELESVRADIEDEERVVEALRKDRADLEADLDGLAQVEADSIEELEATISRHRESIQALESTISELQSVIQFNESMLAGAESQLLDVLQGGDDGGSVTDRLVAEGEAVVCWTCGSEVDAGQVEDTLEFLRELHAEKVDQRNDLRGEIEELESERKHIERTRDERRRLTQQLAEVDEELEERTDRLEALRSEADELAAAVEDHEATVEAFESDGRDERLERHREVNELEFQLDRLETDLDDVEAEIASIEARLAERDDLVARQEAIDDDIEALRSRIERLEAEAVEAFNDQMDRVLDLLEFDNLERVWVERVQTEVTEGRRTVSKPTLDLHVVRTAASGSVYEDRVDHLSESEREVVGLVFALSGYLVHDVYEQVPIMLLDSLEALDADRIADLIDHLAGYAANLVVALLPEDAAAVDGDYARITDI